VANAWPEIAVDGLFNPRSGRHALGEGNAAAAPVDPERLTVRGATVTLLACGRD
jgi:hypothetical protein